MRTLRATRQEIQRDPQWWCIHLMNFVDDFRRYKNLQALSEPFEMSDVRDVRIDALLASTAEALCDELSLVPPAWVEGVPACNDPWFVGDLQRLKAISIVESPLRFRMRKIFVLENFLTRV
jgi:hypothetical protein